MPIYEYAPRSGRCRQCDGRFEVYQKIADAKLAKCPDCGKPVERVVSAPALQSGRYSTSNARVKELGMTKYKKAGDGVYERVAGSGGPRIIHRKKTAV
jgi:putative FmdB family regulatory protein